MKSVGEDMMGKIKTIKLIFLLLVFLSAVYLIWRITRPIEIVDVHGGDFMADIVFKNPPLTKRGLIAWWEQNKDFIQKRYGIPKPNELGSFEITLWDIGAGYEAFDEKKAKMPFPGNSPEFEQFCFDHLPTKINCLNKDNKFGEIGRIQRGEIMLIAQGVFGF